MRSNSDNFKTWVELARFLGYIVLIYYVIVTLIATNTYVINLQQFIIVYGLLIGKLLAGIIGINILYHFLVFIITIEKYYEKLNKE